MPIRTAVGKPAGGRHRLTEPSDETELVGGWVPEDPADDEITNGDDGAEVEDVEDVAEVGNRRAGAESGTQDVSPVRVRRERHGPWGRLAERWVPEPLRDSRIDPGRRGALILTVIAAVAALAAAIGVWRDRPEPRPITTAAMSRAADSPANSGTAGPTPAGLVPKLASLPSSPSTASTDIVVSVTGMVARPGLVRLKPGARVADAITAAGGTTSGADVTGMNLAAKLTDGQSVVVTPSGSDPSMSSDGAAAGTAAGSTTTTGQTAPIDLNSADATALDALPGVGPVTAANIVGWRDKNGRFTSVEQLQEIPGIGPAKFAQIAPLVTI